MSNESSHPAKNKRTSARTLLALDRRGGRLVGVVLDAHDPEGPRVTDTVDVAASELGQRLETLGATPVVLIPGADVTCRVVSAPEGPREEAIAALELECEADFGDVAPPHRRSVGLLPGAMSGAGVLTCWPDRVPLMPEAPVELADARCVPVVAALSALVTTSGWAYAYDKAEGWIAMVQASPERPVARVFIEDGEDPAAWNAAIERVRVALNPNGAATLGEARALRMDHDSIAALEKRLAPRAADAAWLSAHGLALGAALIAGAVSPGVRSIATLRVAKPKENVPPHIRLARWVSVPRHAIATLIVAILLLTAGPIAFAWARYTVLSSKAEGLDAGRADREQLRLQAAMFADIEKSRWPMTKLFSDLSRATPVGVDVETVRLVPDGGTSGVSMQGTAKTMDLVNQLESNLTGSGVFSSVKVTRTTATAEGVEFNLTAGVRSPHTPAKLTEDFAASPLTSREGFVMPVLPPTRSPRANGSGSSPSSAMSRPNTTESSSSASSRRPVADNSDPPPALTDDDIAKMNRSQATLAFAARRGYLGKYPNVDGTTRQRLQDETAKLRARMDELAKVGT